MLRHLFPARAIASACGSPTQGEKVGVIFERIHSQNVDTCNRRMFLHDAELLKTGLDYNTELVPNLLNILVRITHKVADNEI